MLRTTIWHCLLLGAFTVSACTSLGAPSESPFSAVIEADCGPTDGPAFTLSITPDPGKLLIISIYRTPDIQRRATFSFSDPGGSPGNALYRPESGADVPLSGRVSLNAVQRGLPVQGQFDLSTANGARYGGWFSATWGRQQAYCG